MAVHRRRLGQCAGRPGPGRRGQASAGEVPARDGSQRSARRPRFRRRGVLLREPARGREDRVRGRAAAVSARGRRSDDSGAHRAAPSADREALFHATAGTGRQMTTTQVDRRIEQFQNNMRLVRTEVGRVIVGNEEIIDGIMTCLLAGGHVLLEGIPGVGKTELVHTLADVLHLKFSRIQFTPDLMPGRHRRHERSSRGATRTAASSSSSSPGRSSPTWCWPTRSTARRPRRSRRCSRPCRRYSVSVGKTTYRSSSRSSCWRRRTRSRWRAPIRCPKRSSTASSSS